MSELSFSCKMCGHCCHGVGGIIIGTQDLPRLLEYFQMDEESFLAKYTENFNNKPCLIVGSDEYCYFFETGKGCAIHTVRPNVCRAWPYFRGNLIDEVSLEMAKMDCHGICRDVSHQVFAHDGYAYLLDNKLLGHDPKIDGRALIVREDELPPKK